MNTALNFIGILSIIMCLFGVFNRIKMQQNQKEKPVSKRAELQDGKLVTSATVMLARSSCRPRRAEPGKGCEADWS